MTNPLLNLPGDHPFWAEHERRVENFGKTVLDKFADERTKEFIKAVRAEPETRWRLDRLHLVMIEFSGVEKPFDEILKISPKEWRDTGQFPQGVGAIMKILSAMGALYKQEDWYHYVWGLSMWKAKNLARAEVRRSLFMRFHPELYWLH
jgi:hypothetical protein